VHLGAGQIKGAGNALGGGGGDIAQTFLHRVQEGQQATGHSLKSGYGLSHYLHFWLSR